MMNHFQGASRGMSSQLAMYTTRKKTANVMVGKSMRRPWSWPGDRGPAPMARWYYSGRSQSG